MNKQLWGAVGLALAIAPFAATGASASAAPSAIPSDATLDQITRARFGLDSSAAQISTAQRLGHPSPYLGISTTPAEDAEMDRRERSGEAIQPFGEAERSTNHADEFAGGYLDQSAGGVVMLGYLDPTSDAEARARRFFPQDSKISLFRATHTLASLVASQAQLREDLATNRSQGILLQSASLDTAGNVVEATINAKSDSDAEARLAAKYGDSVHVTRVAEEYTAKDRTTQFPSFRGGQRMGAPQSYCTMGWSAKSNSDSNIWMVTAGHCVATDSPWAEGYATGTSIGPTHSHRWFNNTNCDCGLAGPIGIRGINGVYVTDSTTDYITSVASQYSDYGGMPVKFSGGGYYATGHNVTGTVFSYSTWYLDSISGYTVNDVGEVHGESAPLVGGDSGGPWYSGSMALGVESGGSSTKDFYSHVWRLSSELNVQVVTYDP